MSKVSMAAAGGVSRPALKCALLNAKAAGLWLDVCLTFQHFIAFLQFTCAMLTLVHLARARLAGALTCNSELFKFQERRKELSKQVSKMGEDAKIAIRNVRKDVMKKADKVDFSKDQKKDLEDKIQKVTDSYVKKVEDSVKTKNEEVMKV